MKTLNVQKGFCAEQNEKRKEKKSALRFAVCVCVRAKQRGCRRVLLGWQEFWVVIKYVVIGRMADVSKIVSTASYEVQLRGSTDCCGR